jgi:hypothetical protein
VTHAAADISRKSDRDDDGNIVVRKPLTSPRRPDRKAKERLEEIRETNI